MSAGEALVPDVLEDHGDLAEMSPEIANAFVVYANSDVRSIRRTAHLLGKKVDTVRSWSRRYSWAKRLALEDGEVQAGSLERALTYAASLRMAALQTLSANLLAESMTQYGMQPDYKTRNDAAKALLGHGGMRPYVATQIIERTGRSDEYVGDEHGVVSSDASVEDLLDALVKLRRAQS